MKRVVNWLGGTVTALVSGAEPEGFLNRCARENLPVWGLEKVDEFTLRVKTSGRNYRRLCQLAGQCQCSVRREETRGVPFFLLRFRRRYALLAGLAVCLGLVLTLSRFVLVIDVEGNQEVSTAEILSQLRLCGVGVGTYGPSIESRDVANKMLLAMNQLQYFSLNLHGTRAEVIVRERSAPPKLVEKEVPTHIISSATGIVTHIEPWMGDPCFQEGETVLEGEILITGLVVLEPPPFQEISPGTMLVHAQGRVLARTWHTITAEIPLTVPVKSYTGRETVRRSLSVMGERVNFYQKSGISYDRYDTITKSQEFSPAGDKTLPFIWQTETAREYTLTPAEIDRDAAVTLLKARLLEGLEARMDEGKVLRTDYRSEIRGDFLTVTLLAECTEQIGRMVKIDTDEKVVGPKHPGYGGEQILEEPNTKEQGQ